MYCLIWGRKFHEWTITRKTRVRNKVEFASYKNPLERIMETFYYLREHSNDDYIIKEINYCLKSLSDGNIYEGGIS